MHKPDQDTKSIDAKAVNGAARSGRKRRKRRRWSAEEKIRITRESFASSESVTAVAARYGIARNRLSAWRSQLRRAIYDSRSEKRPLNDRQLAFEDLEGAVPEVEEAVAAAGTTAASSGRRHRAPRRNHGHLLKDLERIEHVIQPDSTQCPCGCGQMIRIGEDRTERLDIVPAKLRVIVTVRPKYACRTCEQGVIQAAALAQLIMGGLPTEGALARDQRPWAGPDPPGVVFFYASGRRGCHAEGFLDGL